MIEASEFPSAIPYRRLFPWIRLFRGIGMALDFRKWVLAAMGLMLLAAGWGLIDRIVPDPVGTPAPRLLALPEPARGEPSLRNRVAHAVEHVAAPILLPAELVNGLVWREPTTRGIPRTLLALCWALLVWGIFGGAIARLAMIEIAAGRRDGLLAALRFSGRKLTPLIVAPLGPAIGTSALVLILVGFGLLYRIPGGFGAAIAGVFGFIPLLLGLGILWNLIWLGAGWPLMVASVAAEADDTFDALSRSHSYVFHRPWLLAFHTALAWIIGVVGFVLVGFAARWVLSLAAAGLTLGAPHEMIAPYFSPKAETTGSVATGAHHAWILLVGVLIQSWVYSYFWCAAAQVYLLLRREIDGTPIDEVALVEQLGGNHAPKVA